MSASLFHPFNLNLTVMAPVHIGSGERLSSMEFQIQHRDQQNYLSVFSLDALIRWIGSQPNAERLASLLTGMLENPKKGGLGKFIADNHIPPLAVESYAIPLAEGVAAPEVREVLTFIKTAGNRVYLPGSSLKGAFRSALLRGVLLQNKNLRDREENIVLEGIRGNKTNSNAIESEVFVKSQIKQNKWSNYDLNRLMSIRDSTLFDPQEALRLYAVRILSVSDQQKLKWKEKPAGNTPTTVMVEMLPPGFSVTLPVIWKGYLLSELASEIRQPEPEAVFVFWNSYLREASRNLLQQEVDFYRRHDRNDLKQWFEKRLSQLEKANPNACFLPLGWGSGYDAKTVTDLFSENTFAQIVNASKNRDGKAFRNVQGLGRPGNNPNEKWLGVADSPKSRKVIYKTDNEVQPIGWVAIHLEPASEDAKEWLETERERLRGYQLVVSNIARAPEKVQPDQPKRGEQPQKEKPAPSSSASKSPAQPKPQTVQLITHFEDVPKAGDVFEGSYVDEDAGEVLYEIPGLDFDTQAYAVVRRSEYPAFPKKLTLCRLTVKEVIQEVKNYYKVVCDPEW